MSYEKVKKIKDILKDEIEAYTHYKACGPSYYPSLDNWILASSLSVKKLIDILEVLIE